MGGPGSVGPWPGRAELWGAGDWPCCSIAGARADGPGGLKWGPEPWVGWEESLGWAEPIRAGGALQALAPITSQEVRPAA